MSIGTNSYLVRSELDSDNADISKGAIIELIAYINLVMQEEKKKLFFSLTPCEDGIYVIFDKEE